MPDHFGLIAMLFMSVPLLGLLINNIFKRETAGKFCLNLGIGVALLQIGAAVLMMMIMFFNHKDHVDFSLFWDMSARPDAAYFRADMLSLAVILTIGTVMLVSLLKASSTMAGNEQRQTLNFSNLLYTVVLGMNGIALVNDLFSLYVFIEIAGISSFLLIALFKDKRGLEGAFKYLAMSAIASAFLLGSLALIFMETGSLQFDTAAELLKNWKNDAHPVLLLLAFVFFVSAVSIKTGLAPFHGWLPDAYQSAPPAVSVLLGGIVTKACGAYAVMRILANVFKGVGNTNMIFSMLALGSIIFGSVAAIGQSDFKRMLAYSSISQIGYIVLGAACGNVLGLAGAVFHFFNHAVFKTTLFVNAAVMEKRAGTTDIENMEGLRGKMPMAGFSSLLAFLSAAGIPPLAGFWSKLLIILAVWKTGHMLFASAALFATIFTMAYFLRLQRKVFFGKPAESAAGIIEVKDSLFLAEALMSCLTVGFGLGFPVLLLFLQARGLF